MLWDDLGCIGEEVMHGYDSNESYSWRYSHMLPDMEEHRTGEFYSRIHCVMEKAKYLDEYFTYCTLSSRPADMELVNWWFDKLCKS